jgi:hypothetical protein
MIKQSSNFAYNHFFVLGLFLGSLNCLYSMEEEKNRDDKTNLDYLEYKELYKTKDKNVLIDQTYVEKITFDASGRVSYEVLVYPELKQKEVTISQLTKEDARTLQDILPLIHKIPGDNPWTSDYLWEDTKTYTVAAINSKYKNKPHSLEIVIKIRNESLKTKKIEDLPTEVIMLKDLIEKYKKKH